MDAAHDAATRRELARRRASSSSRSTGSSSRLDRDLRAAPDERLGEHHVRQLVRPEARPRRAPVRHCGSGHADAIAHNGIGPAYIAAARLIHETVRLSPEDSLVLLTRVSYVLAVALGVVLVRVLLRQLIGAPPMVTIGAQFAFVGLVFAAGTWHWSDVPWSHFFAAFLAVAVYALRFAPARLTVLSAAGVGVALALLSLTRSFEFGALVLAWGIAFGGLAVLRLTGARTVRVAHVVSGSGRVRGDDGGRLWADGQARVLSALRREPRHPGRERRVRAEVAPTPTFSFSLVPTKLVQLFVEPCYRASVLARRLRGRRAAAAARPPARRRRDRRQRAALATAARHSAADALAAPAVSRRRGVHRRLGGQEPRGCARPPPRDQAPRGADHRLDRHRRRVCGEHADRVAAPALRIRS